MWRGWLPPLIIVLLIAGGLFYRQQVSQPVTEQRQFLAFGTLISVTLREQDAATRAAAFALVEQAFRRWHNDWHAWQPSQLTRLNETLASGGTATVEPQLLALLKRAKQLAYCSGDRFDPAIGGLLKEWGFQSSHPKGEPPDRAALQHFLSARPSMAALQINGETVSSSNRNLLLDLGAVAKGFAIDVVSAELLELGIDAFIVNAGGDLRAHANGSRPWRIGIRNPQKLRQALAVIIVEEDESIFTSGTYERFFDADGRRYHHILDPRTGYPTRTVQSVTLVHTDATVADAAATALLVAGLDEWPEVAVNFGIEQLLLLDADGTAHVTPAMAARLEWQAEPPRIVTLPLPTSIALPGCPPTAAGADDYTVTTHPAG